MPHGHLGSRNPKTDLYGVVSPKEEETLLHPTPSEEFGWIQFLSERESVSALLHVCYVCIFVYKKKHDISKRIHLQCVYGIKLACISSRLCTVSH